MKKEMWRKILDDDGSVHSFNWIVRGNYEQRVGGRIDKLQNQILKFMLDLEHKEREEKIKLIKKEIDLLNRTIPYRIPPIEEIFWEIDLMKKAYNILKGNYTGKLKYMLCELLFDEETRKLMIENADNIIGILLKSKHLNSR